MPVRISSHLIHLSSQQVKTGLTQAGLCTTFCNSLRSLASRVGSDTLPHALDYNMAAVAYCMSCYGRLQNYASYAMYRQWQNSVRCATPLSSRVDLPHMHEMHTAQAVNPHSVGG